MQVLFHDVKIILRFTVQTNYSSVIRFKPDFIDAKNGMRLHYFNARISNCATLFIQYIQDTFEASDFILILGKCLPTTRVGEKRADELNGEHFLALGRESANYGALLNDRYCLFINDKKYVNITLYFLLFRKQFSFNVV